MDVNPHWLSELGILGPDSQGGVLKILAVDVGVQAHFSSQRRWELSFLMVLCISY